MSKNWFVCMCMSVLCLRGGCMFCVTFPAWAFFYLFVTTFTHMVWIIGVFLTSLSSNTTCSDINYKKNWFIQPAVSTWIDINMVVNILYKRIKSFHKKIMIQLYCNALHVWLSIPLRSIAMSFSLVVRWQTGFTSTWWCIL